VHETEEDIEGCVRTAAASEAVIVTAGCDYSDEGEYIPGRGETPGGDRRSLSLHGDQIALIRAVGEANPNTAVVLFGGSTIIMEEWRNAVPAILFAFYPGLEGGNAVARTLFGSNNPGGKLPFVVPKDESALPVFDREADSVEYGYFHGYTKLDKDGIEPAYYFGHGLSYTTFNCSDPAFATDGEHVTAECTVTNTGGRSGDQTIQFYVGFRNSAVERPAKLLRGFRRITLEPGQSERVAIACPVSRLRWYNPKTSCWELERMVYQAYIGPSSDPAELLEGAFEL
jgi:beta-glucosidase